MSAWQDQLQARAAARRSELEGLLTERQQSSERIQKLRSALMAMNHVLKAEGQPTVDMPEVHPIGPAAGTPS